MPQKNAQDRLWKILTPVLLVLAVLAMAKTLFVGLEIDEEYAFSLGFRLIKGDRLFYTMWEPHQLSALPAALVLALYTAIVGTTTGALLFVRAVVLACKAAMSAVFYREFRQTLGRHGALLGAVVLFVYTPKWFLGPDYISQQFHFTVAAFFKAFTIITPTASAARGWWCWARCAPASAFWHSPKRNWQRRYFHRHGAVGPPRQGADHLQGLAARCCLCWVHGSRSSLSGVCAARYGP